MIREFYFPGNDFGLKRSKNEQKTEEDLFNIYRRNKFIRKIIHFGKSFY
jgi:hypothetical protein